MSKALGLVVIAVVATLCLWFVSLWDDWRYEIKHHVQQQTCPTDSQ